ncbi:Plexin-A4, partial [Stegodyphus mimosarum]
MRKIRPFQLFGSYIFCFILTVEKPCIYASKPSDVRNLIGFVDHIHPSPFQRIVVYNGSRDVYVSARNSLYHFDENLNVQSKVSTGPELDNPDCLHPSYPCDNKRVMSDNDNKVLEIIYDPHLPMLLSCGTLYQGLCQVRPIGKLVSDRFSWVGPFNESVGFTAGKNSTVAFFAPGYGGQTSLYSASTYDDRPLEYSPASVSSKVLVRK